ncbi:hypothetical protein GCM10027051_36420 [Niabella terrae]
MSLQPFEIFKAGYIRRLLQLKKYYLVAQSYRRGTAQAAGQGRTALLLTDYEDAGQAKLHYNAVRQDPYAAIIDLRNDRHLARLQALLSPDSKYLLFWAVVRSAAAFKRQIDRDYKEPMRQYIATHTDWDIRGSTVLRPGVDVSFGELFITLKKGREQIRLKFEELEKP